MCCLCLCLIGQGTGLLIVVTTSVLGYKSISSTTLNYDPPLISALSPGYIPTTGTNLTITGQNFGTTTINASVSVAGGPCPITLISSSSITCTVPAGAGGSKILVNVVISGQTSNSMAAIYVAPSLTLLSPQVGQTQGGTILTLTGHLLSSYVYIICLFNANHFVCFYVC